MLAVFNVCFGVGIVLTLLNTLFSLLGVFNFLDFDFDFDFDFEIGDFDFGCFLPLSPTLMIIFITTFGGFGRVLYDDMNIVLVVIIALAISFFIFFFINKFLARPLRKLSSKETADTADIIGLPAVVSEKIFEDGYGKVTFKFDDNTISGPAKSANNEEINTNSDVVILDIKNKVYIVERL